MPFFLNIDGPIGSKWRHKAIFPYQRGSNDIFIIPEGVQAISREDPRGSKKGYKATLPLPEGVQWLFLPYQRGSLRARIGTLLFLKRLRMVSGDIPNCLVVLVPGINRFLKCRSVM